MRITLICLPLITQASLAASPNSLGTSTMSITLSSADYKQLWQAVNPSSSPSTPLPGYREWRDVIPAPLGHGYIQHIQLREVQLSLFNYRLHDDLFVTEPAGADSGTEYEFGFNLSGNRSGIRTGENFLNWGALDEEEDWVWQTYADDPVLKVDIHLESATGLIPLIADSLEELPAAMRQCIEAEGARWFSEVNAITPAMRLALEQILHCPFQGKPKQIYLEGKCLELIALKLAQLQAPQPGSNALGTLNGDDIDRIHAAQRILVENPDNPPSLMELARQVSLNDYKLKVGFKTVFGTTVFGYLHHHRMELARQMLSDRRLNVGEVAQAVGYANQSRFAAAFRKQFGVNPKAYLLSKAFS